LHETLARWCVVFFAGLLLCLVSTGAQAQLRSLANPSFELNDPAGPGAPNYEIITNASVVGWDSTTNEIELWDSNFLSVPAYDGNVFAEMNANVNGTLYQNICLITGEPIGWTFAHRARSDGPATQTAIFQVANSSGTVLQSLATQNSTTANQVWNVNTGSTTYTGATGLQRVQFTTSNTGSLGNFLDGIQMALRPFVQLSGASGSGLESVASVSGPTLLVTGRSTTAFNVTMTVTGGTATLGTDYTTPGGAATFTITVPAGTYNNTAIPLGITVTNDNIVESSETISLSLAVGANYTLGNTSACGAAIQSTSTYTITDDDSRVTLRKQWVNAAVGDDTNVTISRSATVIDTLASDAGSANELDTDATPTPAVIGETLTLAEALVGTNIGSYTGVIACTGAADTNLANGLTIAAGETNIICTYTNSRVSQLLSLAKVWAANSVAGHIASATTSGALNNATFTSTAPVNGSGSTVTVFSGEVITLPAETYGGGGTAAYYATTVVCTGGTILASGATGRTITISNSITATVCTYTNTRRTATLTLRKTWVNAVVNNAVTLSTSGFIANTSLVSIANTANETDTGTAFSVFVGDAGTITESFTAGVASTYNAALSCTGNAAAIVGSTLTISTSDTVVVCTITNTTITPLIISKTSTVVTDGVNVINPKAIPGANVRYCILVTNPGTLAATVVSVVDPLPSTLSYISGTLLSGVNCLSAATVEDDDNIGADEADPFGVSVSGLTITGVTSSLGAGATFAIVFNALIN
jgi:trimeric autotransporter adhesin